MKSKFANIMKVTPSMINRHFVIRWREATESDTKGRLIGAGRYAEMFGEHYASKHFEKAWESGAQRLTVKIRGQYIITFNSK